MVVVLIFYLFIFFTFEMMVIIDTQFGFGWEIISDVFHSQAHRGYEYMA